jgi:membrane associated rhomboid family serine protease
MAAPPSDSTPLAYDMVQFPVVCATFILCVSRFMWINRDAAARVADCAMSFKAIMCDGHFDRVLFAQISHESLVHLSLNMSSLLSLHSLEPSLGSPHFLKLIIILLFLSGTVMLCSSFALYKYTRDAAHITSSAIGFSCVLFGLTSFQSLSLSHASASITIFGLTLPALFAPFASLIMVSLLVPTASFAGHFSGIIAGFASAALSLHTALPASFLAALLLLCLASKRARSHTVAAQQQQEEQEEEQYNV